MIQLPYDLVYCNLNQYLGYIINPKGLSIKFSMHPKETFILISNKYVVLLTI